MDSKNPEDHAEIDDEGELQRRMLEIVERGRKDDDPGMLVEDFARLHKLPVLTGMGVRSLGRQVRLRYDDYVAYTEAHPDDDFELIAGDIYEVPHEDEAHMLTRHHVHDALSEKLDRARYTAWMCGSIPAIDRPYGPYADIYVSRGPFLIDGKYAPRPTSADVVLVIEISSTTRIMLGSARASVYASLGIPELWHVDLANGDVRVYSDPDVKNLKYRSDEFFTRKADAVPSAAIEGLTVETKWLLQLADPDDPEPE